MSSLVRDVRDIPGWMRLIGSRWLARLLVAGGVAGLGVVAWRVGVDRWWHWPIWGAALIGPPLAVNALISWRVGRGELRCTDCGKLTPFFPAPARGPGMSEPHLRCVHCSSILWGL